jgi:hypothetical protein
MSSIERRFKILALLCMELGVLERQMTDLANEIDNGNPQGEEALTFYEDKIIEILSKR